MNYLPFIGSGFVFIWYPQKNFATSTVTISEILNHSPQFQDLNIFTVPFRDDICQNEELVGGKAKSLALLSSIETSDVCNYFLIIKFKLENL